MHMEDFHKYEKKKIRNLSDQIIIRCGTPWDYMQHTGIRESERGYKMRSRGITEDNKGWEWDKGPKVLIWGCVRYINTVAALHRGWSQIEGSSQGWRGHGYSRSQATMCSPKETQQEETRFTCVILTRVHHKDKKSLLDTTQKNPFGTLKCEN